MFKPNILKNLGKMLATGIFAYTSLLGTPLKAEENTQQLQQQKIYSLSSTGSRSTSQEIGDIKDIFPQLDSKVQAATVYNGHMILKTKDKLHLYDTENFRHSSIPYTSDMPAVTSMGDDDILLLSEGQMITSGNDDTSSIESIIGSDIDKITGLEYFEDDIIVAKDDEIILPEKTIKLDVSIDALINFKGNLFYIASPDTTLKDIARDTYNSLVTNDSRDNGFLDGWHDPSVSLEGLVFSIGRYDHDFKEFNEKDIDYEYDVDIEKSNTFPLILNDMPGSNKVKINFNLDDNQKKYSLFLNNINWHSAKDVKIKANEEYVKTIDIDTFDLENRIDFSPGQLISGKNSIEISIDDLYSGSWFGWDSIQFGTTDNLDTWHKLGVGESFDNKASPEEVGFYLLSHIGAYDFGFIDKDTTKSRIKKGLEELITKPKINGLFYRFYSTHKEASIDTNIPSIGNSMLAASLMSIYSWSKDNNLNDIQELSQELIDGIDLRKFWNPQTNRFYHNLKKEHEWNFYSDEGRLLSFVALAKGDISESEFLSNLNALKKQTLYYNLETKDTLTQRFQDSDIKVENASWDASMFPYLVPSIFIQEHLTDYSLKTIIPAIISQIKFAEYNGYKVWGISDCFGPDLVYYCNYQGTPPSVAALYNNDYMDYPGLITPHASAFVTMNDELKKEAIENLKKLKEINGLYVQGLGFKDSVDLNSNKVTQRILTLDQEWIMLSLMNAENNTVWINFYRYPGVQEAHNIMYPSD